MNQQVLAQKRIAILVTDGFEQVELTEPRRALDEAGAKTVLVALNEGKVKGWKEQNWGDSFPVDQNVSKAKAEDFDGLLLPGGVISADKLRENQEAVNFVKNFFIAAKPVAAICHGPWILIDANVIKGRTLTSYPSLKADLANAGAKWMDSAVIFEGGLVTSRRPADLPAFNRAILKAFGCDHYEMQKPMGALKPEQAPRTELPDEVRRAA